MSAFLRLAVGVSVLLCPAAAPAPPCPGCGTAAWVDIPLRDNAGNVQATMRVFPGAPGKRQISFIDGNQQVINTVTEAAPAVVAENPLQGQPIPEFVIPDEPADAGASIKHLQDEVDALNAQVKLLTARINAAAAK
jgi:hypothetical protein